MHLCETRQQLEQLAASHLSLEPDFKRLQSIPGIGPVIALTVLAETGNIRRFKHVNQFINFCGFNLCTQQSGTYRGKTHLSKRGNARLRQVIWMAAQVASTWPENTFRNKFKAFTTQKGDSADVKRKGQSKWQE